MIVFNIEKLNKNGYEIDVTENEVIIFPSRPDSEYVRRIVDGSDLQTDAAKDIFMTAINRGLAQAVLIDLMEI